MVRSPLSLMTRSEPWGGAGRSWLIIQVGVPWSCLSELPTPTCRGALSAVLRRPPPPDTRAASDRARRGGVSDRTDDVTRSPISSRWRWAARPAPAEKTSGEANANQPTKDLCGLRSGTGGPGAAVYGGVTLSSGRAAATRQVSPVVASPPPVTTRLSLRPLSSCRMSLPLIRLLQPPSWPRHRLSWHRLLLRRLLSS